MPQISVGYALLKKLESFNFGVDANADFEAIEAMRAIIRGYDNDGNCDITTNGEARFAKQIAQISNEDDLVIDAGCNRGEYSQVLTENNLKGRLLLIDANDNCLQEAKKRLDKTYQRIEFVCCALGEKDGEANLIMPETDTLSPINSLYDMRIIGNRAETHQQKKVNMQTLKKVLNQTKLSEMNILLLKADIEGSEYSMMKGCEELFKKAQIKYFQFEFGHATRAARAYLHDIVNFLSQYKYKLFVIKPRYLEAVEFNAYVENRYSMANFVAIAPGICQI